MNFQTKDWAYPEDNATRDLRLDFMRGFVIPLLIVSHFDYFSLFMYVGWERIGVISTAEIFVTLAGIVIGMVYGKKLKKDGFDACLSALLSRAAQLYRVNVFIILCIGFLRYVPFIDTTAVTTFHDPYRGIDYPLYPSVNDGIFRLLSSALMLRCGPHQFQVVGLYVVLFALVTPLIFWMLEKKHIKLLLGLSWVLYLINFGMPESQVATAEIRWTGAQFEYAFPLIAWQLVYIHGVVAGYYKKELLDFFKEGCGNIMIYNAFFISFCFILFTLNHPIKEFAEWSKLSLISPETFENLYFNYFQKYKIGPGRLINTVALFISIYAVLTRYWQPFNRAFGWILIPLGQASLYVFFIHIFLLLLVSNTPFPGYHNFFINTTIHFLVLTLIWIMVKTQFLFRWIPR
ncbi:MAG: succinyl transferase OpgC [Methylococcaceae bacterium]|nr:succinyl transferase OpgC [Methylococcaceae bacterium]